MNQRLKIGKFLLDHVHEKLQNSDDVHETLDEFIICLKELRNILHPEDWLHFSSKQCLEHPLRELLHQDPFTNRVFLKPRGYPGDALMLDYIYRENMVQPEVNKLSGLVKELYEHSTTSPASLAVKARRDILANFIDGIAETSHEPHILALACGHLREAKQAKALSQGKIKRYVAFDYDKECLQIVKQDLKEHNVECLHGNIRDVILKKVTLGQFDFVYAAGLFDYLSESVARKLTNVMFELLRPNGKLLICNFLHNIEDIGYMESFMNWKLIYRDRKEMEELSLAIPQQNIANKNIFIEENQNIIFLEIQKK